MAKFNDLDMKNWKDYGDILVDSLWNFERRDNSGAHSGSYHGNFIPQIPNQLFRRYTKKGDVILDPFAGSGTSLIEAGRLGRNAIGVELQENVATEARERIAKEAHDDAASRILVGDSRSIDLAQPLSEMDREAVQFIIYHPPYWDIIKFSEDEKDLSNCPTLESFTESFGQIIDNTAKYLEKGRYCAVVIGDKYAGGEIVPLGFHCMNMFTSRGFKLKGIIVKNFDETKGKSNQRAIWRYRALASDFFLFKHEYIFVFKKDK